jgi:hypothetical protein
VPGGGGRGGGGVQPRPAGGIDPGTVATGWRSCVVIEAGEGGEGLMCGVRATVPVG